MIDFDSLREKAEDFVEDHAEQIDKGIDKAAGAAGQKFGHGSQIEQGAEKLKEMLPGGEHDGDEHGAKQGPGGNRPGGQGRKPGGPGHGPGGQGRGQHGGGQHRPGGAR